MAESLKINKNIWRLKKIKNLPCNAGDVDSIPV